MGRTMRFKMTCNKPEDDPCQRFNILCIHCEHAKVEDLSESVDLEVKSYWIVQPDDIDFYKGVTLEAVLSQANIRWAIRNSVNSVMNRDGEWEYEPFPSNRDDEFKQRCRYDSPEEALETYRKFTNERGG